MAIRGSGHDWARGFRTNIVVHGVLAASCAGIAVPLLLFPKDLVLPAIAGIAILLAVALALLAKASGAPMTGERITIWDVAGATALIGFAAAILGEPDKVVGYFSTAALTP